MQIFEKAFLDIWERVPEARAKMRVHKAIVEKGICEGAQHTRASSDHGQYFDASFFFRCLASEEDPMEPLKEDQLVDIQFYGTESWRKYRIAARKQTAGVLTLTMVSPNE